jgi:TfoX/Sxy family transcriptional regulator of competence genes
MSYDEKTAGRVRRFLARRGDAVEKRMFGGLCFTVNGSMCCGLTNAALMVRVGPDHYDEALAQPHARPMDFTGRPLAGMVYVDPKGYETDEALAGWIQRGVGFASAVTGKSPGTLRKKAARK